jgi:hypothetical protein
LFYKDFYYFPFLVVKVVKDCTNDEIINNDNDKFKHMAVHIKIEQQQIINIIAQRK